MGFVNLLGKGESGWVRRVRTVVGGTAAAVLRGGLVARG